MENFSNYVGQNEIIINNIDEEIAETPIGFIQYEEFQISNDSNNSIE